MSEWTREMAIYNSLSKSVKAFIQTFQSPGSEAARLLVLLRKGKSVVRDYLITVDSVWNQPALINRFLNSLSGTLRDHLAPLDVPADLEAVIHLDSKRDQRLRTRPI